MLFAQPSAKPWRIAFLEISPAQDWRTILDEFRKAFRDLGYAEGSHYAIEGYYAESEVDFPRLARRALTAGADLILTWSSGPALAAKRATSRVPIVFMSSGDPVGWGLVESLSRPGANLTGVSNLLHEITPKQFDLLHDAFPHATHVAVLMTSRYPSHSTALGSIQARAARAGVRLLVVEASTRLEIDSGFESMARQRVQAVLVMSSPFFAQQHDQIVSLGQRAKIPCVGDIGDGFVIAYWPTLRDAIRRGAELAHKILRGAKPADLPVAQPTRFRLTVNLKAARTMGARIPEDFLARADRLIE